MNRRTLSIFWLVTVGWGLMIPAGSFRVWAGTGRQVEYMCPMHPDVKTTSPGKCPKCGMALRVQTPGSTPAEAKNAASSDAPGASPGASLKMKIPETAVYDQDGRKLAFYSDLVKGKTVAINFIFTTCTTICPPLAANFARVQRIMQERMGRDVALISVSVDPTVDVPRRLKSFLERYHAQPGWTFVTGSKADIEALLGALGASVADKNDHTPMVLVGNDPVGYWTRAYGLSSAPTLASVITKAADLKPGAKMP
jgi:protein SCO1